MPEYRVTVTDPQYNAMRTLAEVEADGLDAALLKCVAQVAPNGLPRLRRHHSLGLDEKDGDVWKRRRNLSVDDLNDDIYYNA